jgi:hypothetical protein
MGEEGDVMHKIVVSYGGGVNSVAALVQLWRMHMTPTAIVMADPGSERIGTIHYRDNILPSWLYSVGFPQVEVITRIEEGRHVQRAWRLETLRDECMRIGALPSVAYGWKKCSAKYKGDTQRWWAARQPWAQEEWAAGRKLIKVIGYDAGELRRVKKAFQNEWEDARFAPYYPLVDAGLDRDGCETLILGAGLPLPPKSACKFCPNNTLEEWEQLRDDDPKGFGEAVKMSRNAAPNIESPEVVGLMRCNPHGKRQLHVWADGGYAGAMGGREDDLPCECAL